MSRSALESHSDALFALSNKPYSKSTPSLVNIVRDVIDLATCLSAYALFLDKKAKESASNKALDHPVRSLDEWTTVVHMNSATSDDIKLCYNLLDTAVRAAGLNKPVLFDEDLHIAEPFENNMQRYRFWSNVCLSVPIDVLKFSPGGGAMTTYCLSQTTEQRTNNDMLTDSARLLQQVKPFLKEFHTRSMKRQFKRSIQNIASIQPAVLDFVYSELSLDRSAFDHPEMQQRIKMMIQGEPGLITDLRHFNPGRPSDYFDVFFQKMIGLVESHTAADDRRHGEAHMSQYISLEDLIKQVADLCPENTPIPSKALVRL